jgi:hypothetical protein
MANGHNDDPTIEDAHPLWRRIPPGRWTYDHNLGRARPNSDCFRYSPADPHTGIRHPMSVVLGAEVESVEAALGGHADFKLVSFTAARARQLALGAARDPQPDLQAHALVFARAGDDIPRFARNRLAEEATWVTELTPAEVEEARQRTSAR